ncbi:MAG: signal peptide peptidase SppA [Flammeovirgaceae bacterium]|nr:signal peptide peptidase SppA [Flammeovirgaceae bacterium]|tara:strand:+ start:590 stop:2371 length:1782 start_codon:yes stop_codon:yes gene_type:complete
MDFLKNILKNVVTNIIGFFVSIFLIFIIFTVMVAVFSSSDDKSDIIEVKENSILFIDDISIIGDRDLKGDDLDIDFGFTLPGLNEDLNKEKISLRTFKILIDSAKNDNNIRSIVLNLEDASIPFNKLKQVRDILSSFRELKPIYSHSDYYTKSSYYLSSISDLISVSPPGFINISGFGIYDFFYKELFDELGIKIELFRVGEFKGAAETYVRNEFSEENKKQYSEFLNERFNFYLTDISESRNLKINSLINFINNYETELLSDAINNNLVDTLFYTDQFDDFLKLKIDSSYNKVSFLDYKTTVKTKSNYSKDKIAILYALGGILPGKGDEGIFSESIIKEIKKIKKNKNIKSVIFYINSGGGSAFASDIIHREIELLNKKKPVIVYMSDVCASGGYYIGMPADTLISSKHSILGSIGVFGVVPDLSGLVKNKLKINIDEIKTSQNIGEINLLKPLNKKEKNLVQRGVNQIYDDFLKVVSIGRKMSKEDVNEIARGRVYYGERSKEINLVDILGNMDDAIKIAANKAKIEKYQIVEYPRQKSSIEKLVSSLNQVNFINLKYIPKIDNWLVKSITEAELYDPIHMRMEFQSDISN